MTPKSSYWWKKDRREIFGNFEKIRRALLVGVYEGLWSKLGVYVIGEGGIHFLKESIKCVRGILGILKNTRGISGIFKIRGVFRELKKYEGYFGN